MDLTRIINDAARGRPGAADELLALIYDELRAMARRYAASDRAGLEPTALVHEAWLRIRGGIGEEWNHRSHFFGAAAQAMRRILVEEARRRSVHQRASAGEPPPAESLPLVLPDAAELLDLDAALQSLEASHPRLARVVELRYFGGLAIAEIAAALDVSVGTVERDWRLARARLQRLLGDGEN